MIEQIISSRIIDAFPNKKGRLFIVFLKTALLQFQPGNFFLPLFPTDAIAHGYRPTPSGDLPALFIDNFGNRYSTAGHFVFLTSPCDIRNDAVNHDEGISHEEAQQARTWALVSWG